MRASLAMLLLVACAVRLPRPGEIGISVKTSVRASAYVEPPPPAVALEGAPVVEFFGIPLDGAQDVVFVLDISGSMSEAARGRIAQVRVVPPPPPVRPPPPGPPPPPP